MRLFLTCIAFIMVQGLSAQKSVEEKHFPFTGQYLDIDLEADAELSIKAWDKQEIFVKIVYEVNEGTDNEALKIDIDNYDDRLALDLNLDPRRLSDEETCCCDDQRINRYDRGKIACLDVKVTVMVPAQAEVGVETITSNVTISGMTSDIEVETITGIIDLTWQQSLGADLRMHTTTGSLYTNVDLKRKYDKGLPSISTRDLKGMYLGGGKEVRLKTVTGAIYFRKTTD